MIVTKERDKSVDTNKRLLNILEIKMYDVSQNIEIIGSRLSTNQIKQSVAQFFCIFGQLKPIYQHANVDYLYEINKKMLTNIVFVTSILSERSQKHSNQKSQQIQQDGKETKQALNQKVVQETIKSSIKSKISKLGGINLYNETYLRGIQYQQFTPYQCNATDRRQLKNHKTKQQFLGQIKTQIQNKTDVQIQNDEIRKYIDKYKQNSKIQNFISNENQITQIIDFFKITQISAINFLNKAPNNNNQYTQNYLTRLQDLQKDIKWKQNNEKINLIDKMKLFMINLKLKIQQIQKIHEQKMMVLNQSQKKLKKQVKSGYSQTQFKIQNKNKQYQNIIRQLQQRYNILTQVKNKQFNFQSQYYMIQQEINIKIKQIQKLKLNNEELKQQIQLLKKIIRDDKDKRNITTPDLKMYRLQSNKLTSRSKQLLQTKRDNQDQVSQLLINTQGQQIQKQRQAKLQKKAKKIGLTNGFRSSIQSNFATQFNRTILEKRLNTQSSQKTSNNFKIVNQKDGINNENDKKIMKRQSIRLYQEGNAEVNQEDQRTMHKIISQKSVSKNNNDEQRQVSFQNQNVEYSKPENNKSQRRKDNLKTNFHIIQQISRQTIGSLASISHLRHSSHASNEVFDEKIQKTAKKTILKQRIDSHASTKSIQQGTQAKSFGKSTSKKCILLKQSRQKNKITTILKIQYMQIENQVVDIIIKPTFLLKKQRSLRPSHTSTINQQNSIPLTKINEQKSSQKLLLKKLNKITSLNENNKSKLKNVHNNDGNNLTRTVKDDKGYKYQKPNDSNKYFSYTNSYNKIQKEQNSINYALESKKSIKQFPNITKKAEKQKNSRTSIFCKINNQSPTINTLKQLKQSLKKHYKMQQSCWKTQTNSNASSQDRLLQYINEQLKKQNLSIQQFNDMMTVLQDQYNQLQSIQKQKQNSLRLSQLDHIKQSFYNTYTQQSNLNKDNIILYNKTNQIKNNQNNNNNNISSRGKFNNTSWGQKLLYKKSNKSFSKFHKENNHQNHKIKHQHLEEYQLLLNINSINKIKNLHYNYSKCKPQDHQSHICQHLEKYFNLFKKIKEIHQGQRECLKLHIEQIGSLEAEHNGMKEMERGGQNMLKQILETDQRDQERILPIINNNTTSLFYKGKSKLNNGK